jgi:hypothetical protein
MTGIDELLRDVLSSDADTQAQPVDLTARSMRLGRRMRQRRTAGIAAVALTSVGVIVGGSLAVSAVVGDHTNQTVVVPAAHGPGKGAAHKKATAADGSIPSWTTWPADRRFGDKPADQFLGSAAAGRIYADGTLADGTDFVLYGTPNEGMPIAWYQGWNSTPDFGDAPGEGSALYDPYVPYFAMESPTFATGREQSGKTQWLIVVGQPGTTTASYSADGITWQQMQTENGIAVIKIPAISPAAAQIRLSDADGQYVDGPLHTL